MPGKHDQIAGSLIKDILTRRYDVNERLPSERDLAVRFNSNRGAVREAMKKLEQLGLAEVKPGGARVKDRSEASLDVIGHMLAQGDLPDAVLVDQVLVVISSLMGVAAEQTLELATDEEIDAIRSLSKLLYQQTLTEEAHTLARFELLNHIIVASKNLPLQIIARSLFGQFTPNMSALHHRTQADRELFATFAQQLDRALERRDVPAVRVAFAAFSDLNRKTMMRAFAAARADLGQEAQST
ncbi:MAG: FadR family transcriptional regulator [Gammaproteobacteria bacterium]|nr:FadR family transcriptional regulator [Gammaproteobacteria bacterium]